MIEDMTPAPAPEPRPLIVAPPRELARLEEVDDLRASGAVRVIWLLLAFLFLAFIWARNFSVAEVSVGSGKVIPSAREQHIDTLGGGVLTDLYVKVGDVVKKGQVLARLDPTQSQSELGKVAAQYHAALAQRARLMAEVEGHDSIDFPDELKDWPKLRATETALFDSRRQGLKSKLKGLREQKALVNKELQITTDLQKAGAASRVQMLRLQQQVADLDLKITDAQSTYMVGSRGELSKADEKAKALQAELRGREEFVQRNVLRASVRGIVKQIDVNTIGGAVPPGGTVMTLVPLGDQLLVEARISPRDIAYIHPGQKATVKVTAYDYSIYGGLDGAVATISPDTVRDKVDPKLVYYPVYIRTDTNALVSDSGKKHPIVPGMVTTTEIHTGSKTVWSYLVKPFSKAGDALHER